MTQIPEWGDALHRRIAWAIRAARTGKMSAQELADATEELGHPVSRNLIANYESGRKQGMDIADLVVIALALGVPLIALLLYGSHPEEEIQKCAADSCRPRSGR